MFIDTHAHLSFSSFSPEEIPGLLKRAEESQVETIINIGAGEGFEGNRQALDFSRNYPNIYATVGMHPHDADLVDQSVLDQLYQMGKDQKVVAIGEIGLDFYYNHSNPQKQEEVFREMITLSKELELPISIHVRDAYDRLYQILLEENGFENGGVIHCFSGDWDFAAKVLDKGFYISFSGIVTFKKSAELREVARKTPIQSLLIETDAPFLTPEPYRGKKNEPSYVPWVAKKLAEIKEVSVEEIAEATSNQARALFRL